MKLAVVVATALVACGNSERLAWPDLETDGCPSPYNDRMRLGFAALDDGRFDAAATAFSDALSITCFEIPNYEATGPLAEALCLSGRKAEGLQVLANFRCMLDVDSGNEPCFRPGPPDRAAGLTESCFATMCGEIYLPYYEHPSATTFSWVATARPLADQLAAACR
jgi:hypothetical protein